MGSVARSESDLPVQALDDGSAQDGFTAEFELGAPGRFPFARGVYPSMHTGRPWTMRKYAGCGTAKEPDERHHELISADAGDLSVVSDLPTPETREQSRGARARRRAHRCARHRQRPAPDARCPAAARRRQRGLPRPARRLGCPRSAP